MILVLLAIGYFMVGFGVIWFLDWLYDHFEIE